MDGRRNVMLYGTMSLFLLFLVGCPPPATTKPGASSAPARPSQVAAPKEKPAPAAGKTASPRTSLEAFQAGKAPAQSALKEVYFDFDKYDIRPDARPVLRADADWLKKNPAARVEIEGHADERGTNEYNLALGAKRAQAVKEYLVTLGVETRRFSTISYGEEVPVCREKTEECLQKNRRARLVVMSPKPAS